MSAPANLLSSDTSHPFQTFCPSRDSLSRSSSSPSIYVTFKVLQLIHTFRKRVKTRVQRAKRSPSKRVIDNFCQEAEKEAYHQIDRYLGKTVHSSKRHWDSSTLITATAEQEPSETFQWLLDQLDQAVKSDTHSLTAVASNNKLFVQRKEDFILLEKRLSVRQLIDLIVVVKDLLKSLQRLSPQHGRVKTLCEGKELLDSNLDETYLANLQHLLLCLEDQLLRLLVAKLVEVVHKHVIDCQRDQSKLSEDWFFEFPDARHPLSTTWPWSIKPSLAVIWGVCWMFYDHNDINNQSQQQQQQQQFFFDQSGNMVNGQGDIVVPSQVIDLFRSSQHHPHQTNYFSAASQMPRQRNPDGGRLPRSAIPHSHSSEQEIFMASAPPQYRGGSNASVGAAQSQANPNVVSAVAHGPGGLAIHGTNNTYTAAPPAYDAHNGHGHPDPHGAATYWLPEDGFAPDVNFHDNAYAAAQFESWQHLQPQGVPNQQQQAAFSYPPPTLPPQSRGALPPAIRVTTEFSNTPQQPQDLHHSPTPVSSTSSHPSQVHFFGNQDYTLLSPQTRRLMAQEQQQEMQTPPRSPQQAGLGESNPRKRSHSVMSEGAAQGQAGSAGSRSGSVASGVEHSMGEEYSPRNRTVKREDPPMNDEHKYICTFSSECSGLTFDRKCEWSKHMDKHDRPYRCPHPSCAKLQGFTYSGGLLRHEREVHGKHGGPKTQMMCPHEDCKRHSGKGFTRKENLNEHIRRVHQSKDYQTQTTPLKREATDAYPGADDVETPASDDIDRDERSPVVKRRRLDPKIDASRTSEDFEKLLAENQTLRQQNEDQANRLRALEVEMAILREQMSAPQPEGQAQT